MHKKEIENSKSYLKSITKAMSVILVFMVLFSIINTTGTHCFLTNPTRSSAITALNPSGLEVKEKISEERFVYNEDVQLDTGTYPCDSIIQINITVLLQSNASVEIFCQEIVAENFSPALTNSTLAPGESFTETYKITQGLYNSIVYFCFCSVNNATVQWWYEVLVTGKTPTAGFLVLSGALILLSLGVIVHSKRKAIKISG